MESAPTTTKVEDAVKSAVTTTNNSISDFLQFVNNDKKRTELLWRNLLPKKPLQILHILLGSMILYSILRKMSTKIPKKIKKTFDRVRQYERRATKRA